MDAVSCCGQQLARCTEPASIWRGTATQHCTRELWFSRSDQWYQRPQCPTTSWHQQCNMHTSCCKALGQGHRQQPGWGARRSIAGVL